MGRKKRSKVSTGWNVEKIMREILGMRDLYYANILSIYEFKEFVEKINSTYGLTFKKSKITGDSNDPFATHRWSGYNETECVYNFEICEMGE